MKKTSGNKRRRVHARFAATSEGGFERGLYYAGWWKVGRQTAPTAVLQGNTYFVGNCLNDVMIHLSANNWTVGLNYDGMCTTVVDNRLLLTQRMELRGFSLIKVSPKTNVDVSYLYLVDTRHRVSGYFDLFKVFNAAGE